jgi:hypothetical protein
LQNSPFKETSNLSHSETRRAVLLHPNSIFVLASASHRPKCAFEVFGWGQFVLRVVVVHPQLLTPFPDFGYFHLMAKIGGHLGLSECQLKSDDFDNRLLRGHP